MKQQVTLTWRRLAIGAAALFGFGLAGALLVAWSGIYSVAASRGHPAWMNMFLELGMRRSVEANAPSLEAPDLDDPGLIALGASHFQDGCAPCHGGPGEPVNPIYKGMLPVPPKLEDHADSWSAAELHWIVKHGLQYAGMPGWAALERDDEVWAMVAFLQVLPDLDQETYLALAAGNSKTGVPPAQELVSEGLSTASLVTCSKCHDTPDAPPTGSLVPRLGGQSAAYLERTLRDYRTDERQSGFMEPVAAEIPQERMAEIAAYYAALDTPPHPGDTIVGADLDAGLALAMSGDPSRRIGACQACHGGDARETFPRLAGQSAAYIAGQLELWRDHPPSDTAYGRIMSAATGRITDDQIRNVAAWYASQPPASAPAEGGRE